MRHRTLRTFLSLVFILGSLTLLAGWPQKLYFDHKQEVRHSLDAPSPLLPQVDRIWSVRFDPSYYYRGQRPSSLARELAETWENSGVNLVFYRALDPRHGTFYRTDYTSLAMGEFGQYDLLKHVLRECHHRGIKVFAWLPVLNLASAWESHPEWQVKDGKGKSHQEKGLEYPLCVGNSEVREWWVGLIDNLLTTYPELDGVDLGEPVLSWRGNIACRCTACQTASALENDGAPKSRVDDLTRLLRSSIDTIHRHQKQASITAVQSAHADGSLWTFDQMKQATGFDWPAAVSSRGGELPDFVCPEFIWQEWKSSQGSSATAFSPDWTQRAVTDFLSELDSPVPAVVHVELTDFPDVPVTQADLRQSIRAALAGGANGIDVYSTNELDRKKAWPALRALKYATPLKDCLVVHDNESDMNDAIQTAELLRHFNVDVTHLAVDECTTGTLERHDHIFYVGTDAQSDLPAAFVSGLATTRATVCWLGMNVEQALQSPAVRSRWAIHSVGSQDNFSGEIEYKGTRLKKEDPWMSAIQIQDASRSKVWATAVKDSSATPYAVQCGRHFWHFGDVPTSYALEGSHYLVFADLLHEILNENHTANQLAMVRIEDVHPLTDPRSLKQISRFLAREDVPFQVATVPIYAFPEQDIYVRASERPDFVAAMKRMVKDNGAIVMHGTTHQRFDETTSDYEYWDAVGDQPPEDETAQSIHKRVEAGLDEFWRAELFPLAWETPHYAGSQTLYETIGQTFSLAMERRQSIDRVGSDELFPYLIQRDRFGQIVVPENLGYIPLNDMHAEVILQPARKMKVVRDGVASFFYHPFLGLSPLKEIVREMKKDGYRFAGVGQLPVRVQTPTSVLSNMAGSASLQTYGRQGYEAVLTATGGVRKKSTAIGDFGDRHDHKIVPASGEVRCVCFPAAQNEETPNSDSSTEDPLAALEIVSNARGEKCRIPWPLLVTFDGGDPQEAEEAESFRKIFDLIGVDLAEIHITKLNDLPRHANIVIIPSLVATHLRSEQVAELTEALRQGRISLITTGFSRLSDELMIERAERPIAIRGVFDNYYPELAVDWHPSATTHEFEAPGDADFIYSDRDNATPVLVGATLGKGAYLFSSVPLLAGSPYPYLLTHLMRHLSVYPLIWRSGFDVYFNPGDRENAEVEMLVKQWKRSGVQTVYAAAWHVFPEWTYDYGRLIDLAHNNGIQIHAWFGLPYVNDRFWMENPHWQTVPAVSRPDRQSWNKAMNFGDKACFEAARREVFEFLRKYDWDGVVLDRSRFDFKVDRDAETAWLESFIRDLEPIRRDKNLELIVAGDLESLPNCLRINDRGTGDVVRVMLREDASAATLPSDPTEPPCSGIAFYERLKEMIDKDKRVALDSESAIHEVDRLMLLFLTAGCSQERWTPEGIEIESNKTVEARLPMARSGVLSIDGREGASFFNGRLILPAGRHVIQLRPLMQDPLRSLRSELRIVDLTGDLLSEQVTSTGVKFAYRAERKALLVLSDEPRRVWVDGKTFAASVAPGLRGFTVGLPAGEHQVRIQSRGIDEVALAWGNLLMSNAIVTVSSGAIICLALVMLITRLRRRRVDQSVPSAAS